MPFCPREARLVDGGWDSNVFGTAVWKPLVDIGQVCWQHRGGPLQFPWQHRDGSGWQCCVAGLVDGAGACWLGLARPVLGAWLWPPLGLCPPLQHPCANRFPRSDVGLPLLAWTAGWACSIVVVGVVNAGMLVWCASNGMSMPLLAAIIALVVGSMLSRPVTVSGAVFACLAWHPHLFSWCASKIPGAATLSFARPKVASFPRPNTLVTVAAFLAEGSMNRPLLDLGTPAPMAFGGCLCNGCPSELFADWLTLLRVVLSARPRRHLRSAARPRGRLSLVDDGQGAPAVAEPLDSTLDPPAQVTDAAAQSDPSTQSVPVVPTSVDPVASEVATPVVRAGSVESSVAAPRGRAASAAPSSAAPMVRQGPTAPASAAPMVRQGPTAPASAAPVVRKSPAPAVRKGPVVPASAAPVVRKGQAVPTTAAPVVRKGSTALNVAAPVVRTPQPAKDTTPTPSVPLETDVMVEDVLDEDTSGQDVPNLVADGSFPDDAPYDPMVHAETSDMLEEALEISRDCVLLADLAGVIQAEGEDLVNEVIPEAADSIIREVAASILGVDESPADPDAPVALAQKGPSHSASPSKSGLSKSAPAGLRRAAMPVVPEHQEFDEWCAARSHSPPANVPGHSTEARASSIPPPRPHKRHASSSDPSRAKRSRASSSSSTRIPSTSKVGMSSVNNSPAETARQSRREK
ncbi:hypothetical protein V6N11_013834 [Hibiscus sabdariffa]|uniref:Uncharacterized protein n=1 Tax=Hibiscus sabdariffa TaxID=183260 RepID=A0ABR1ZR41_9ROSI